LIVQIVDALSDVLSMLNVSSVLSSRFEGRGKWAFRFPSYASQIKFGCVLSGRLQLSAEGVRAPVSLEAGDFYLLTNGRPFCTTTDPGRAFQDGPRTYRRHRGADGVVLYGGAGSLVALASGRFTFDGEASELLLRHLPPLIHLSAADPGSRPLATLLDLLRWETSDAGPGASIARTSIATLVLVQALRIFLSNSQRPEGWLGAMADRRIGIALSSMHGDLAHRWTVESLASAAGMSRTGFAVHFKRLTGATPLDYLSGWRMTIARGALKNGNESISAIAERVGYQSDTAFSAAFKRATGQSPGRFKSAARAREDLQV
jgi:AraC-like DNA-binding protein